MKIRPVIYKLQKQALDYAANELADSDIGGIARFNDLFTEKFAELIINECCREVPYGYAEFIREHFGIEQ